MSSAARLAKDGFEVEVIEKLPQAGGRNNLLLDQGFRFDMGPSFVLMPDLFEEVFLYCREDPKDYLNLRALDVHYKIFYTDGESVTVYNDPLRTKEELERIEKGVTKRYEAFLQETGAIYRAVKPLLQRCFTKRDLLNPANLSLLPKIHGFQSYWGLAGKYFKSEKLRYALTFEAMFIGVSPFETPAFYSIITYADHVQKVFHPMGGMYQIPLALEKMAKKFGARFMYNTEVENIQKKNGGFLLQLPQDTIEAERVIANADYAYTQKVLLGRSLPKFRYSCSVYLLYLGLKRKIRGLAHHNLFFAKDLKRNLEQIFEEKSMPLDPSFYVHVPTVTDPSLAPLGKDIVYILVPVPNLESVKEKIGDFEDRLRKTVFDRIKVVTNESLDGLIETEHTFYPEDFIRRYNIHHGATFGLAHTLMQSAFFRPKNFDSRLKGLYFVGASTQPGGGLPVVIASSRIVADLVNVRDNALRN